MARVRDFEPHWLDAVVGEGQAEQVPALRGGERYDADPNRSVLHRFGTLSQRAGIQYRELCRVRSAISRCAAANGNLKGRKRHQHQGNDTSCGQVRVADGILADGDQQHVVVIAADELLEARALRIRVTTLELGNQGNIVVLPSSMAFKPRAETWRQLKSVDRIFGCGVVGNCHDLQQRLDLLSGVRRFLSAVNLQELYGMDNVEIEQKSGKAPVLLEGVGVVQAGVARLVELQEQGWSYIRP